MDAFLVSLLNLFGLVLVVRLTLPERYALLNPYAAAMDTLLDRLFAFLRTGLPLPRKGLCALLLVLVLAVQAALVARQGAALVAINAFALFSYPARSFLDWLGVAALRFLGFYVALQCAVLFLRLWHLGRRLPGYTGDLLHLAARPFSMRSLGLQCVCTLLMALGYVALVAHTAAEVTWPMSQVQEIRDLFTSLGLPNAFDLSTLTASTRMLFLAGVLVVGVAAQAQNFLFMVFVALLITRLFKAQPTMFFLMDAMRLLTGPIKSFHLGPVDMAPLAAYFLLGLISTALTALLLVLAQMTSYVA